MRIIAGQWRGRTLVAPSGRDTRPTADRTRETLYSMLVSRIGSFEGLAVADLFAGSGALGLEALSRGAERATFVENDRAALAAINANAAKLGATGHTSVRATDARRLPPDGPFDLILADPPYAPGSGTAVATAVHSAQWLAIGGWLAIETQRGELVRAPNDWTVEATRDVGRARITLIRG